MWKTGGVFDNGVVGSGVLPLASPGAEPKRHWLSLPLGYPAGGVAVLVARLPFYLSFVFSPIPPPPFPAGRGEPKVYFAGGEAPGTPALNRLRHLQTLRTGVRRGRFFTTRVPAVPAGANAPFEAERTGCPQAMPVPRPVQPLA